MALEVTVAMFLSDILTSNLSSCLTMLLLLLLLLLRSIIIVVSYYYCFRCCCYEKLDDGGVLLACGSFDERLYFVIITHTNHT